MSGEHSGVRSRKAQNKASLVRKARNTNDRDAVAAPHGLFSSTTFWILAFACLLMAIYTWTVLKNRGRSLPALVTDAPAFEVVDFGDRGKGLVAMRDIAQGELLLKETPLFIVPLRTSSSPTALIRQRLAHLSQAEKTQFYSLSYVTPGRPSNLLSGDEVALAIFQTNAISAGENVGIFPRTARLNHGCSSAFNSVYSWRDNEGTIVVHALKPIKSGQELLTTYMDTKKPRSERRQYLKHNYDFMCACSVCSSTELESLASDDRLQRMALLYETFASWVGGRIDGRTAADTANKIWALGEEEGYWSERGRLAADVAHVAAAHSDGRSVILWAELALTWFTIELGGDGRDAREMKALIARPNSHHAWASKGSQSIGFPDTMH